MLYRKKLVFLARLLKTANFFLFHAILPYQAEIQPDIQLAHMGLGVVIHPNVTIGRRVAIYQHVTLAAETYVDSPYRIVIGDDVLIGSGACIMPAADCGLVIGDGCKIGANALVVNSLENGEIVGGALAHRLGVHVQNTTQAQ